MHWTTHFIAFTWLLTLKPVIQLGAQEYHGEIIKAQVGAAKGTEAVELWRIAGAHCDQLSDPHFWTALETVVGNIEPITYGTNINQADSTQADQVLLTLAGIYLWFPDHPEPEVTAGMTVDIEKCWKDSDQPLFLLALILNPFEGLLAFGPRADLSHFKCNGLLMSVWFCTDIHWLETDILFQMYQCLQACPDNTNSTAQRKVKEGQVLVAFFKYLAGKAPFSNFHDQRESFEESMVQLFLTQSWNLF